MIKSFIIGLVSCGICFSQTKSETTNRYDIVPAQITRALKSGTTVVDNSAYLIDHKTGQAWYHMVAQFEDGTVANEWIPIENVQLGQIKVDHKKENN